MSRVLITGAAGSIGRKIAPRLRSDGHALLLLDRNAGGLDEVVEADLSVWSADWAALLAGVDCVVHLAADARPNASWAEVQAANVDATLNLFEAAAQAGVRRVVFASSNWVLAGHRTTDAPLRADTEPCPVNPYGASKLFGERLCRLYADTRGVSAIALRIGYAQHAEGNRPGPHMGQGLWGQQMWLSDRDLVEGFSRAVAAPGTVWFAVVNLVSDNAGMRWDLSEAERLIGYRPQDHSTPVETPELAERAEAGRVAQVRSTDPLLMRQRW